MEPYLLNRNFETVQIVDDYESLIWTERWNDHGDVEMDMSLANASPADFPKGFYLRLPESDDLMIIESADLENENDTTFKIKGRALTSVLERRVLLGQLNVNTSVVSAGLQVLNLNFITASITARRISNIVYVPPGSTVDTAQTVEMQLENIDSYDAITRLVDPFDIGFRMTIQEDPSVWRFQFYGGEDYSYEQTTNPYVVFSREFDNLQSVSYFSALEGYANVVWVIGEGQGNTKKYRTVTRPGANVTGLDRFEVAHSAANVSSNNGSISAAAYNRLLDQEGSRALTKHIMKSVFEGEADIHMTSGYGVDYRLGDIVQIEDIVSGRARISEYIRAQDGSGKREFPAFIFPDNTTEN